MAWLLKIIIAAMIAGIGICLIASHFMASIAQQLSQ